MCCTMCAVPCCAVLLPPCLVAGREKVRLYGIDAPEKAQSCTDAKGAQYQCGAASTQALKDKIGNKPVSCTVISSSLDSSWLDLKQCGEV